MTHAILSQTLARLMQEARACVVRACVCVCKHSISSQNTHTCMYTREHFISVSVYLKKLNSLFHCISFPCSTSHHAAAQLCFTTNTNMYQHQMLHTCNSL